MSDNKTINCSQRDYAMLALHKVWGVADAVEYIVRHSFRNTTWADRESRRKEFYAKIDEYMRLFEKTSSVSDLKAADYLEEYSDEPDLESYDIVKYDKFRAQFYCINYSLITPESFIEWAHRQGIELPDAFNVFYASKHGNTPTIAALQEAEGVLSATKTPKETKTATKRNTYTTETGKKNSDQAWSKTRAAKRRITDRVTSELARPGCTCDQVQITDFICNVAEDNNNPGKMFWDDKELSGAVVSDVIRQHVKDNFPDRFRDRKAKVVACPAHAP